MLLKNLSRKEGKGKRAEIMKVEVLMIVTMAGGDLHGEDGAQDTDRKILDFLRF